jgi:hypothetical protein
MFRLPALFLVFIGLLSFRPVYGGNETFGDELHRVKIVNRYYGSISVSVDRGKTWKRFGRVLKPLNGVYKEIQEKEFTASDWGKTGSVTATAVNAIHVKVGQPGPHAAIFSILPKELMPGMGRPESYFDEPSTLYVDNSVATGLFGPEYSPFVGSPFFILNPLTGEMSKPEDLYAPKVGDTVVIVVKSTSVKFKRIVFENAFDGKITGFYNEEESAQQLTKILGRVLKPVTGSGRFGGSTYIGVGLLRANHPGVICVSTGPVGEAGGFQIVPAVHASDLDLAYVRTVPVWMVVGPLSFDSPPLEGTFPLFSGLLRPGKWVASFRWQGSEIFEPLEAVSGKKLSAFLKVEEIALERLED